MPDPGTDTNYSGLLTVWSEARDLGLLGPGPVEDHLDHSLRYFHSMASPPRTVVDMGSGAGVPGLALAIMWPEATVTLLDAGEKRCAFLTRAVRELDLGDRVRVVRGRAEELGREERFRESFDLVTVRSFGGPSVTAECASGLLTVGGWLLVSEPPGSTGQRWPETPLRRLSLELVSHRSETNIVVLTKAGKLSADYPRRVGLPAKRPIF